MTDPNKSPLPSLGVALSRGVVVLDQPVHGLCRPLQDRNFRTFRMPTGLSDSRRMVWLAHRILITMHPDLFVPEAPEFEMGVIDVSRMADQDVREQAAMVSAAYTEFQLRARPYGFLLMLEPGGRHTFHPLTE